MRAKTWRIECARDGFDENMCGICGGIGVPEEALGPMMKAMGHRGPDDEGSHVDGRVSLGARRLSIIDIEGGHQPIFNESGTVAVVFNGEIYNFRELRKELQGRGHRFQTLSDTEALVHSYEEWGPACVERLRGMFAFAVYDRRAGSEHRNAAAGRLFLARDRLGIKPLYYYQGGGHLLFASEVRALLLSELVPRRLSPTALQSYLLFGSVSEPVTLVEGVRSIPPGHRMLIEVGDPVSKARPEPYWDLASAARAAAGNQDDLPQTGHLRSLLEDSVRRHLVADVPVGVFLSSGIDSTALAALAAREQRGIHTFTVAFPEQEFSEAEPARQTALRLGTEHSEQLLSVEKMLGQLDESVDALDQPTMDGTNTYFVSQAAREAGLKVALSGLGGDELFGGYGTFRWMPRLQAMAKISRRVPSLLRGPAALALAAAGGRVGTGDPARKIAALWREPDVLPHPYFLTRAVFTPRQAHALLNGNVTPMRECDWWPWAFDTATQANGFEPIGAVSCLEARSYMVNTLLRDTDCVSMAHSLEVRVPFLDHPLVEFVVGLPDRVKYRRKTPKAILMEALEDVLPPGVGQGPKRAFTLPWARWLRGTLRWRVEHGLTDMSPSLGPVLSPEAVQKVWHAFLAGRTGWSRPWSLYVLNEWTKRHLDGVVR